MKPLGLVFHLVFHIFKLLVHVFFKVLNGSNCKSNLLILVDLAQEIGNSCMD